MESKQINRGWMIRASRGGRLIQDFLTSRVVALGWNSLGDLSSYNDKAEMLAAYTSHYDDHSKGKVSNAVSMLYRFGQEISQGDLIISYNSDDRCYLLAEDQGEYVHDPQHLVGNYANQRRVRWFASVSRDQLSTDTRNRLSATLTLFRLSESVIEELLHHQSPLVSASLTGDLFE